MIEKTNYEGSFPSSPELDYYNLYHKLRKQIEGVTRAHRRLQEQAKDNAERLERVLLAYAQLEDMIDEHDQS